MTVGTFGVLLSLTNANYISDLSFLRKSNPTLAVSFTFILFSLAGIPPLAGFFAKFYLFFAVLSSSYYLVAIIGILTSCISCFYYLRLIKVMYFSQSNWISYDQMSRSQALLISTSVFALFLVFLFPNVVYTSLKLALLVNTF